MWKTEFHCSGCASLVDCETAFEAKSEQCDLYVRNDYFPCNRCLRFGQACQRSGLVKCAFLPRACHTKECKK